MNNKTIYCNSLCMLLLVFLFGCESMGSKTESTLDKNKSIIKANDKNLSKQISKTEPVEIKKWYIDPDSLWYNRNRSRNVSLKQDTFLFSRDGRYILKQVKKDLNRDFWKDYTELYLMRGKDTLDFLHLEYEFLGSNIKIVGKPLIDNIELAISYTALFDACPSTFYGELILVSNTNFFVVDKYMYSAQEEESFTPDTSSYIFLPIVEKDGEITYKSSGHSEYVDPPQIKEMAKQISKRSIVPNKYFKYEVVAIPDSIDYSQIEEIIWGNEISEKTLTIPPDSLLILGKAPMIGTITEFKKVFTTNPDTVYQAKDCGEWLDCDYEIWELNDCLLEVCDSNYAVKTLNIERYPVSYKTETFNNKTTVSDLNQVFQKNEPIKPSQGILWYDIPLPGGDIYWRFIFKDGVLKELELFVPC